MKYVALYPRVSTQEQAREGYSIDEQIERLKAFCAAMGWKNYKLYIDAGYSGGNTDRPALQEMIQDIKKGKIEKVVVYKLDRLSRSQKDTMNLIEDTFLSNGVDFVSISENFDTSSAFGRAMVGILAVFAQLEREQIKERLIMGREARAKEGKWLGVGNVPIGYEYIDGELIINDYEAMQIKELFQLYLSGLSPRKIALKFGEKGYKSRYGAWYEKRIVTTLQNNIYAGFVTFNKKSYKGNHEAIIDADTFEKVQHEIEARRRSVVPAARKSTLLSGLLFCKRCGARYGIYQSGKYKYYACYSRRKRDAAMIIDPNCKNKTYNMNKLDEAILNEIKKLEADPDYFYQIKSDQQKETEAAEKIRIINAELEKIDIQISRFLDLYGLGTFSAEQLQGKIEPLKEQKNRLTAEAGTLAKHQPELTIPEAAALISSFSEIVDRGNYDEIRAIIEALIEKIEIDGDEINIFWKF